jgi:hypothetical protein
MKPKQLSLGITLGVTLGVFLGGCADEYAPLRGQFLSGCVSSGTSKTQCQCTFEKLAARYSPQALQALNRSQRISDAFMAAVAESALACRQG